MNSRTFRSTMFSYLTSVALVPSVLFSCSKPEDRQFSFFARINDDICQRLNKSDGPSVIKQTIQYLPWRSIALERLPDDARAMLQTTLPHGEFLSAEVRLMGFP